MSWKPEYIVLLLFSTMVGYITAILIVRAQEVKQKKHIMILGVLASLSVLFFFKYFNFLTQSIQGLFDYYHIGFTLPEIHVLLPIGISFYTFHTLNYILEVYWGRQEPERHPGKLGLFVAFFPLLVAGPIERSKRLIPQINQDHKIDYDRITDGLKLMSWGFFKKLVIADRLAPIVNTVYDKPHSYTGIPLIIATFFFAIQIYCDFSGYTDIAIGAAKVLGYDLMQNFRRPYFAQSLSDFWRRWHISLSSWFRDYLYIPLGGNRVSEGRLYINLLIVFLVSGLWHGANWTFVIWGGLHGIYLVGSMILGRVFNRFFNRNSDNKLSVWLKAVQIGVTFLLVLFAWVFFRANTVSDAFYIVGHIFQGIELKSGYGLNMGGAYEVFLIFVSILVLLLVDFLQERGYTLNNLRSKPVVLRWAVYYALVFSILLFGKLGTTAFIYFQF